MPDFALLIQVLQECFGCDWKILLRLHPQLTARHITSGLNDEHIIDVSNESDMFEILAVCDAVISDYSAVIFDAAFMRIPVFLYVYDLQEYIAERGQLMWKDMHDLPFPIAESDAELAKVMQEFDEQGYQSRIEEFFQSVELLEDGHASERVADIIEAHLQ